MEQQQLERSDAVAQPTAPARAGGRHPLRRCVSEALEAQPQARRRARLLPPSVQPAEREQQCLCQLRSLSLRGRRRLEPGRSPAAAAAADAAAEAAAITAAKAAAKAAAAADAATIAKADADAATDAGDAEADATAAVAAEPCPERLARAIRPAGHPPLVRGA